MKPTRQPRSQPRRDAWVEIDLGALEHNARALRALVPADKELMAVIKADAYGHGAAMCIPLLEACGVSRVGVASVDEALQLRDAGVETPILVLGGVPDWAVPAALAEKLTLTVFTERHLDILATSYRQTGAPATVHVKVDTGMNRIGVPWREAPAFFRACKALAEGPRAAIRWEGVFTHFASAEDPAATATQWQRWQDTLAGLDALFPTGGAPTLRHAANSVGALRFAPALAGSAMVRMGIAFYGYVSGDPLPPGPALRPVMGLKARISHLHGVEAGEAVSYGGRFVARRPTRVATLPLGYADGVPRGLSDRMEALVRGVRVPQIGSVTMDQLMLDVTDLPGVGPSALEVGETVTLLGREGDESITLTDWARALGTIEYEPMCGRRVRRPKGYVR